MLLSLANSFQYLFYFLFVTAVMIFLFTPILQSIYGDRLMTYNSFITAFSSTLLLDFSKGDLLQVMTSHRNDYVILVVLIAYLIMVVLILHAAFHYTQVIAV